jgi:peptide/nickel transport system substrate-binding protein
MRRAISRIAAVFCLAALPAAAQQQTLNVVVGGAFTSMDPHYHNLNPNNVLTSYVFDPLVRFDPRYNVEPSLAVSWKAIDDTTWEFKLRDGVTFHDGTPFTANDVVFTYGRIPKILNSPSSFNFAVKPIEKIEVVDAHTIRLKSATPLPLLPYNLANVRIVSAKTAENATTGDFNSGKAAIGTGPYKLTSFMVGERALFARNDAWWDKKPVWAKVDYRSVANDASRNAALQAGEADIIDQVATRDVAELAKSPKLRIVSAAGQRLIYLAPDATRPETLWVTDLRGKHLDKNPLADARVRHALSVAINRDGIRDRIMDGFAAPTGQLMPEGASGYEPSLRPDPYDPELAKKLLAEAGYPEGFGLTLHGPNNRYVNDFRIVEAIAQMWTRAGVKTQVETMPAATFFSRAVRGEFSIRLTGWASDTGEASSNLTELVASSNPDKGRGAVFQPDRYKNDKVDEIVEKALTIIDTAQREAVYREAEKLAMPDYPIIPIHHQVNVWALRKGLVFHTRMQEGIRAWDVEPE